MENYDVFVNKMIIHLPRYFNELLFLIIPLFNKEVEISQWAGPTNMQGHMAAGIYFAVPEYYGEDFEGVYLDFITQYTPFSLNPILKSDANKKEVLYIQCYVNNVQNEDFYRELVLKDNDKLHEDIDAMLIELETFIMSKADLIVHIINDLYPLPLVKNSEEE